MSALSESWAVASAVSCHLCCEYEGFDYEDSAEARAMLGQVFAVIFHVTLYGLMHYLVLFGRAWIGVSANAHSITYGMAIYSFGHFDKSYSKCYKIIIIDF